MASIAWTCSTSCWESRSKRGPHKTVAGYIVEHVGRIPVVGDSVEIDGHRLTVIEMDGLRIATVEATPVAAAASHSRATE